MIASTHPSIEQVSRVRELLRYVPQDGAKRRVGPLCVHGMWRGKDAWLVGYKWTRAVGTPRPDQVRESVLGHAPTLEGAIAMMELKVGPAR